MKEPCVDCEEKTMDQYGYFCDIACGKRTAWLNYQAGMKEVVDWIKSKGGLRTDFQDTGEDGYPATNFLQIEDAALLEDGVPRIYDFHITPTDWQAFLRRMDYDNR